jgi:Holliday junction resolvase RusA-like endonuclease
VTALLTEAPRYEVDAFHCTFTVYGKAEPGGSKKAFPETGPWKKQVAEVAATLMAGRDPFAGPLFLTLTVFVERPQSHLNRSGVKRSAPRYPAKRPDCTKLLRPIEDALTGIVWGDDAQIVEQLVRKRWGEPRAEITVGVLT